MLPRISAAQRCVVPPALILISAVLVGSCTDGPSPTDVAGDRASAVVSMSPELQPGLPLEGALPVNRIRAVATTVGTGEEVGRTDVNVSATTSAWTLEVAVALSGQISLQVYLTLELIHAEGGLERVQWSTRLGPITVFPGVTSPVPNVSLIRGPLANLSVTGVSIQGAPENLRMGEAVEVAAEVTTREPGSQPRVFWASLDPEVAAVVPTGDDPGNPSDPVLVQALSTGTARIVAVAGTVADTVTLPVLPGLFDVSVSPTLATLDALDEEITFEATVVDTNGEEASGEAVTWSVEDPEVLEQVEGGTFVSVGPGTTLVTATSHRNPSLSGSARVTVSPVPVELVLSPTADTLTAIEATLQLSATALDANGNPVPSVGLAWSSDNEEVATVDGTGRVTARGGGTAEIRAVVVEEEGPTDIAGTALVTVRQEPASVEVTPAEDRVFVQDVTEFSAAAFDANGYVIPETPFGWSSSDEEVATVDAEGVATGGSEGEATITAEALELEDGISGTGVLGTASLVVEEGTAVYVLVDPAEVSFTALGDRLALEASATDQTGTPLGNVLYTWSSSDTDVVTVDGGGLVTSVGNGEAVITVIGTLPATGSPADTVEVPVTVAQEVEFLYWAQQPENVFLNEYFDPAPMVFAMDSNEQLVTNFNGDWSVDAEFRGLGAPPEGAASGASGSEDPGTEGSDVEGAGGRASSPEAGGPQRAPFGNTSGTFKSGVATLQSLGIEDQHGYHVLIISVTLPNDEVLTSESAEFYVYLN